MRADEAGVDQDRNRALVRRVLEGDRRAYDQLMQGIEPRLRRFLAGHLASRPEASVDEALQELRLYLFRRLHRYDPQYPVIVFARALGKNIAKRFLYRKSDLAFSRPDPDEKNAWSADLSPAELEALPLNLQAVLGGNRFAPPEGPPPPSRMFLEVLELFFRYGGYPHQQISFGYSILIWGKPKSEAKGGRGPGPEDVLTTKVPVTGDPDRVVREVGPRKLDRGCLDMLDEIGSEAALDRAYLDRTARPLRVRLKLTGKELFSRDVTSRRLFRHLDGTRIGETRLLEYFGKNKRKSVADWTRTVKERIRKTFLDPAIREKIPLPRVEAEDQRDGRAE